MGRIFFCCLVGWLAWPAWAAGGVISLQTSTTCTLIGDGVRVEITVINAGNEAAVNLRISASVRDIHRASPVRAKLEPGKSYSAPLWIHPALVRPGAYPVKVLVEFHDRRGHPFSAVSHGSFIFREGADSLVFAQGQETVLHRRGRLTLELANTDQAGHQVTVTLITPNEFRVRSPEQVIRLKALGNERLAFDLDNLTALAGAAYPVLAFLEYDAGGKHYTSVAETRIRVKRAKNVFQQYRPVLWITGLVLLLAAVFIQRFRPVRSPEAD